MNPPSLKYHIVKPHKSYFYLMKNGKKLMTHWIWLYNMVIYQYSTIYWLFCIDPEWDLPKQKIANILDFCSQVGRICENKGKLSTKKLAKLRQIFKGFPRTLVHFWWRPHVEWISLRKSYKVKKLKRKMTFYVLLHFLILIIYRLLLLEWIQRKIQC